MCGIAGLIGGDNRTIRKMTAALYHRGPDDEGFFGDGDVRLGHRRLSIIDIAGGHQPMVSADGKVAIVFNGEIYNFRELKAELAQEYRFKTKSDTEVILNGYLKWGTEVFERMEGMFAIGIWDGRTRTLVLARDRMGEKPLYYFYDKHDKNLFAFASELKALLENPRIKREVDPESLYLYLSFGQVPAPKSILKNVSKLEAGTMLVLKDGGVSVKEYWRPDFSRKFSELSLEKAGEELESRIAASVKKAMIADVPLGVFLSGGLDSSLVAYFAKKTNPDLETFSIGFKEKSFDESTYAREVAGILATRHNEKIIGSEEALGFIPRIANVTDEPLADPSIIPTFLLSDFAGQKIKVAVGGDGGDEIFMGYQTFVAEKLWQRFKFFMPALRAVSAIVTKFMPITGEYMSLDFKLQRFISATEADAVLRHQQWLAHNRSDTLLAILSPDIRRAFLARNPAMEIIESASPPPGHLLEWERVIDFYRRFYLGDQVLTKVDRASMANSLEVRSPLLNHKLVEYALGLPPNFNLRGFTTKYLLRRIASKYFPPSITKRKKQGFAVPLGLWLKKELYAFGAEKISVLKTSGWFDGRELDKLWGEHQKGKVDRRMELWNLIALQLWRERWLK